MMLSATPKNEREEEVKPMVTTSKRRIAALILAAVLSAAMAAGMASIPHPGVVHDAHAAAAGPKAE